MKCKDYYIVRIRYYASKYRLTKWHKNGPVPKQHHQRIDEYLKFTWLAIENITGKSQEYWLWNYMMDSKQCALDYIRETKGIIWLNGEGVASICIPKDILNEYDWLLVSIKYLSLPVKVVTKINGFSWREHDDINWTRKMSADFTAEVREKYPNRYPPLPTQ